MIGLTPDIVKVRVPAHGRLALTFADGVAGEIVDAETGTVVWPGGADLAPDVLYEHVRNRLAA